MKCGILEEEKKRCVTDTVDPFNFMDRMYQFFVDRGKIVFSGILDFMVLLRSAYIQTDKKNVFSIKH